MTCDECGYYLDCPWYCPGAECIEDAAGCGSKCDPFWPDDDLDW